MEEQDIENYDYLSVTLKKATEEELLNCYEALGWEMLSSYEDKLYVDITHYNMRRSRQIENKDKLLLLQVRVESEVNKIAKFAHDRHNKSIAFGILAGLLGLALISCGIFLALYFKTTAFYAVGAAACTLGVAVIVGMIIIVKRLAEWENGVCESGIRGCWSRLKVLFKRIYDLRGIDYVGQQ